MPGPLDFGALAVAAVSAPWPDGPRSSIRRWDLDTIVDDDGPTTAFRRAARAGTARAHDQAAWSLANIRSAVEPRADARAPFEGVIFPDISQRQSEPGTATSGPSTDSLDTGKSAVSKWMAIPSPTGRISRFRDEAQRDQLLPAAHAARVGRRQALVEQIGSDERFITRRCDAVPQREGQTFRARVL